MSVHISSPVWKYSSAAGNVLLVHLYLADVSDAEGWSWPSVATIAEYTRLGRSTVQRHLALLAEMNQITVHRRPGTSNRFHIDTEALRRQWEARGDEGSSGPRPATPTTTDGGEPDHPFEPAAAHPAAPPDTEQGPQIETPQEPQSEAPPAPPTEAPGVSPLGHPLPQNGAQSVNEPSEIHQGTLAEAKPRQNIGWDILERFFGYRPTANSHEEALWGRIAKMINSDLQAAITAEAERYLAEPLPPTRRDQERWVQQEFERRIGLYATTWPKAAITPNAILKHWQWLGSEIANYTEEQREALTRRARRARRRHQITTGTG